MGDGLSGRPDIMRVDSGKGRPAVFQTDNAEFDSPYPLQNLPG